MEKTGSDHPIPSIEPCTRDWRFHRGSRRLAHTRGCEIAHWQPVHLPHCWNAEDMAPGRPLLDAHVGEGWYQRELVIAKRPGERIFLRLDAAAMEHECWVDGCYLGGGDGGFLATRYDITEALSDDGEAHRIAIRVSNAPRPGLMPPEVTDWERFGGLIRPAWIEHCGDAHFAHGGIALRTPVISDDAAQVSIACEVREMGPHRRDLALVHRILDPAGEEVATLRQRVVTRHGSVVVARCEGHIPRPLRWSPEAPSLYRVISELRDDERLLDRDEQRLGLRTVEWHPQRGFLLNGERLELVGVNAHQDYPGCGHALPARFHREEVAHMKAAGLNCLRGAHYPRHRSVLEACDELGILVIEEQPFWHGSCRSFHGQALVDYAARQARELVRQHGNHPCIIAWNTVNEIMHLPGFHEPHLPPELRGEKHKLPRAEWPYARRVIASLADSFRREDERAVSVVIGGAWRDNCQADVPALGDAIGCNGGTFHSGYGTDDWAVADVHRRYPDRAIYLSEGILLTEAVTRADWDHECAAWKTFADTWNELFALEWFCGGTMWVWADYSAKGTYRTRGMVDYRRLPLESFHLFRSLGATGLVGHICGHWSRDDEPGDEREVAVFHNGEHVELLLDGERVAAGGPDRERWPHLPHPPTVLRVPWRRGELRAVVHRGSERVDDRRVSEGPPAALTLVLEGAELADDGSDVRFVTASVRDAAGERCYRCDGALMVTASGAARHCGPATIQLRGGLARWALRSTGVDGDYRVTAHLDGLAEASIAATTHSATR